jgi:hypothetical protein
MEVDITKHGGGIKKVGVHNIWGESGKLLDESVQIEDIDEHCEAHLPKYQKAIH